MYLPGAPQCKASGTLLVYRQKNRVGEEYPSHTGHDGPGDLTSQTAMVRPKQRVTAPGPKRLMNYTIS